MARRIKWRNVTILLLTLAAIGIGIYSAVRASGNRGEQVVKDVVVTVVDSAECQFANAADIKRHVLKTDTSLIGKKQKDVDTKAIETRIAQDPVIRQARCYKTPSGNIGLKVWQRRPVLRAIGDSLTFYMDANGVTFKPSRNYTAYVLIVTGDATVTQVREEILPLVLCIDSDAFWKAQVEEINVRDNRVTMVPAIGDHLIVLGNIYNYKDKLSRLKKFYKDGLMKIGWGDYKTISAEFDGQIVCEKKN